MKALVEAEETMHVDMTPLVDAIFAIILFLLVVSSYVESSEQDISINLPSTSTKFKPVKSPSRPIVVNVRYLPGGEAYYHVENERLSIPALTVNLTRARLRDKEQAVIIRGDRNVKWDHVAKVMTGCAQAGITKVSATVEVQQ
ncbi:MAG: biopolymer transporter ExbD [bacterium]